jgi:hypothetical protein
MKGPIHDRLGVLLDVFSPWEDISLTYRQFAAELGSPITEAAVKRWPQRKKFPAEAARRIVAKAQERGLAGVTLEWVLWGEGPRPTRLGTGSTPTPTPTPTPARPARAPVEQGQQPARPAPAPHEPHGRYAARIAEALQLDLSHNEFGQWSSAEVQHTVIWALKDLARRLYVLQFDMGKTFELTDEWAGKVGLPVRPPDQSTEPRGPDGP